MSFVWALANIGCNFKSNNRNMMKNSGHINETHRDMPMRKELVLLGVHNGQISKCSHM